MRKTVATIALIAAFAAAAVPAAQAGRHARHRAHDHGGRGGLWIVTPVGVARDADHGNCYSRFGRTFCE
jgi:hypothetical protein